MQFFKLISGLLLSGVVLAGCLNVEEPPAPSAPTVTPERAAALSRQAKEASRQNIVAPDQLPREGIAAYAGAMTVSTNGNGKRYIGDVEITVDFGSRSLTGKVGNVTAFAADGSALGAPNSSASLGAGKLGAGIFVRADIAVSGSVDGVALPSTLVGSFYGQSAEVLSLSGGGASVKITIDAARN